MAPNHLVSILCCRQAWSGQLLFNVLGKSRTPFLVYYVEDDTQQSLTIYNYLFSKFNEVNECSWSSKNSKSLGNGKIGELFNMTSRPPLLTASTGLAVRSAVHFKFDQALVICQRTHFVATVQTLLKQTIESYFWSPFCKTKYL